MVNILDDNVIAITYGICFFFVYVIFKYLMEMNNNYIKQEYEILKKERDYIDENNFDKPININDIKCTCNTFFIDENELENCQFCIDEYLKYINKSKNKLKKHMSFPN